MAKYGAKAKEEVGKAMHEFKEGKLKSGKAGKKVHNPKQAVEIGLSMDRKKGAMGRRRRAEAATPLLPAGTSRPRLEGRAYHISGRKRRIRQAMAKTATHSAVSRQTGKGST